MIGTVGVLTSSIEAVNTVIWTRAVRSPGHGSRM